MQVLVFVANKSKEAWNLKLLKSKKEKMGLTQNLIEEICTATSLSLPEELRAKLKWVRCVVLCCVVLFSAMPISNSFSLSIV